MEYSGDTGMVYLTTGEQEALHLPKSITPGQLVDAHKSLSLKARVENAELDELNELFFAGKLCTATRARYIELGQSLEIKRNLLYGMEVTEFNVATEQLKDF